MTTVNEKEEELKSGNIKENKLYNGRSLEHNKTIKQMIKSSLLTHSLTGRV